MGCSIKSMKVKGNISFTRFSQFCLNSEGKEYWEDVLFWAYEYCT